MAVSRAIISLEQTIELQSKEITKLKAENKKIHDYLQLWTPLDLQRLQRKHKNKTPTEDDLLDLGPDIIINGRALPPLRRLNLEDGLCLPSWE